MVCVGRDYEAIVSRAVYVYTSCLLRTTTSTFKACVTTSNGSGQVLFSKLEGIDLYMTVHVYVPYICTCVCTCMYMYTHMYTRGKKSGFIHYRSPLYPRIFLHKMTLYVYFYVTMKGIKSLYILH